MEETFCEICGEKETDRWTKRYDKKTGTKVMERICFDVSCVRGCEMNGGHQYKWPGFFSAANKRMVCPRCGEEAWGGGY